MVIFCSAKGSQCPKSNRQVVCRCKDHHLRLEQKLYLDIRRIDAAQAFDSCFVWVQFYWNNLGGFKKHDGFIWLHILIFHRKCCVVWISHQKPLLFQRWLPVGLTSEVSRVECIWVWSPDPTAELHCTWCPLMESLHC